MERISIKPIVAIAGFAGMLAGCATTLEMGPGYYRYDSHVSGAAAPSVAYEEPVTVYREPTVVYREPTMVYSEPAVVYRDSAVVYPTTTRTTSPFTEHGQ
jgi:hypothetical protein